MVRVLCLLLFAASLPLLLAQPPAEKARPDDGSVAAGDDALVEKVNASIESAKKFLLSQQSKEGNWEFAGAGRGYPGGWTALVTLALLQAGVPPEDKAIQQSLVYLRTLPPRLTYVVGVQTMVFCIASKDKDRKLI